MNARDYWQWLVAELLVGHVHHPAWFAAGAE